MAIDVQSRQETQKMGALLHDQGTAFRVWAPHAESVSVIGTFNDWDPQAHPMEQEENGNWFLDIPGVEAGAEYRFFIRNGKQELSRVDPHAREVTNSAGNGVVTDPSFDWEDDDFKMPLLNELVVYEMHIGTFGERDGEEIPATFDAAIERLGHLKRLGVNCVELMPVAEFAGDFSWGYNPAHLFAVESAYGGPQGLKRFVREAHRKGIAVILDVVYNHLGPSDLSVWQFDGWSEQGLGGIYFYNDWKSETPWGNTRPDYGRGEVRQYLFDNAMMWLKDYRADGLRYDMTLYIRTVRGVGDEGGVLPDGWSLTQWINETIRNEFPGKIVIAEDLQNDPSLTQPAEQGGASFHTQWDAQFVHPVRDVLTNPTDEGRSLEAVKHSLSAGYNGDPFQRVVYTESHDEVANGKARIPSEIMPDAPDHWFAQKRSTLGALLVLTAPGVPMLFQGQEFLEEGWFQDTVPLDWDKREDFHGVVRMFRDLIRLRLNWNDGSRGLTGSHVSVLYQDDQAKVMAYLRTFNGECMPGDVVVVANFCREPRSIQLTFPVPGNWKLRFNGDSKIYSDDYGDTLATDIVLPDGAPFAAEVTIGPYAGLIYTLSKEPTDA
ncbi:alpha-amylase family glycosyl hydrolase [Planctomicrobium sp. SH661]|uniref:alpha-amylase family glycosyl hydrolase n=1 Tax=Planctomicrobium sp. SH661 TaxID=3448124 RepID=UPI003F5B6614